MRVVVKWKLEKDKPIGACSIDPVHDHIIIGVAKVIYVLTIEDCKEINVCEKHTDDVTCLGFRKDGLIFASGAKDNIIYLWSINNLTKPISKINLKESAVVQVNFNPCIQILIAISKTKIACYKELVGQKPSLKIDDLSISAVSTAWTNDGMRFAIGFENGSISIREKDNDKELKNLTLNSNSEERIWCLTFSNSKHFNKDYTLIVGTWEKNIYIIELFNHSIIDVKKVDYDPMCITLFRDDYFLIGSNSNQINMFAKDGIYVNSISEDINSWVLALKSDSKHDSIVACTQDGSVMNFSITFETIHSIYEEMYVYRSNLMDVIVYNLLSKVKSKIKVKQFIYKLAIYKSKIAVMVKSNIIIYDLSSKDDEEDVLTESSNSITWEGDCSLLLISSNHVIICLENRIQLISTKSTNNISEREWTFDGEVSYLKVIGGPPNRESLICGVSTGEIYVINIDNQFPVELYTHSCSPKIIDISCGRKKLAFIDEHRNLYVIDLKSKKSIYFNTNEDNEERHNLSLANNEKDERIDTYKDTFGYSNSQKANSLAFNSDIEDVICYYNEGNIYIKTENFPPSIEKINGLIVGYKSTKIFLLNPYGQNNINILDTSQSTSIIRYSEKKEFFKAYRLAVLGATREEWLFLGFEALESFDLKIALNCFKKLEDMKLINLIMKVEKQLNESKNNPDLIKAEIKCFKGNYDEAEELYIKSENVDKAIEMWTMLKKIDRALELKKKYNNSSNKGDTMSEKLLLQQAEWLLENGKYLEAADIYLLLNKKKQAIEIYGKYGNLEKLIEILRSLEKDENTEPLIASIGNYFKNHKHYEYAKEAYLKLGDLKSLVIMNIELEKWEEAFYLAKQNKHLLEYTHLQWAEDRIKKDKYKEAQDSYKKAGRIDLSMQLLNNLIDNAIYEKRFKDAGLYLLLYSQDTENMLEENYVNSKTNNSLNNNINNHNNNNTSNKNVKPNDKKAFLSLKKELTEIKDLVNLVRAYDLIYKYIEEPFSSDLLSTESSWIFNKCKYMINTLTNYKFVSKNNFIKGISISYIFYAAAFLAKQFDTNKTARFCFEKLNNLNIPNYWKSKIDFEIMTIRAKPYTDIESQLPLCFRCLTSNPLINILGDKCTLCGYNFVRSSISYEILPLVEFIIPNEITDEKAIELIKQVAPSNYSNTIEKTKKANHDNDIVFYNNLDKDNEEYVDYNNNNFLPKQATNYNKNQNVIDFNSNDQLNNNNNDNFDSLLNDWCEQNVGKEDYGQIVVSEDTLIRMKESDVFIINNKKQYSYQTVRYFKNRMKDVFVHMCKDCNKFFRTEEWENALAKNNKNCPVCNNNMF